MSSFLHKELPCALSPPTPPLSCCPASSSANSDTTYSSGMVHLKTPPLATPPSASSLIGSCGLCSLSLPPPSPTVFYSYNYVAWPVFFCDTLDPGFRQSLYETCSTHGQGHVPISTFSSAFSRNSLITLMADTQKFPIN